MCFLVVICETESSESTERPVFKLDFVNLLFVTGAVVGGLHMIWGTFYYICVCFGVKFERQNTAARRSDRENPVFTIFGTASKCWPKNSGQEIELPKYTKLRESA